MTKWICKKCGKIERCWADTMHHIPGRCLLGWKKEPNWERNDEETFGTIGILPKDNIGKHQCGAAPEFKREKADMFSLLYDMAHQHEADIQEMAGNLSSIQELVEKLADRSVEMKERIEKLEERPDIIQRAGNITAMYSQLKERIDRLEENVYARSIVDDMVKRIEKLEQQEAFIDNILKAIERRMILRGER